MKRIILHWTAGAHKANATDKRHYHFIIEGDGNVVPGNHAPEANAHIAQPNDGNTYAAHTRGLNTGSIGVALAAMRGATERPFDAGPSPITEAQIDALAALCANLCKRYGIPVTREAVLTHAEVQPTLKVAQRGKWDIMWVPGMSGAGDPVAVGDGLRDRIAAKLQSLHMDPKPKERTSPAQSTTVQASVTQIAAGAATGATAIGYLDGTAQLVLICMAGVVMLAGLWIFKERLRKWAAGDH